MPEIQFPDEVFPLTETPGDPVVVTLDLDRIAGIKWEDCKLKIELRPRKANPYHKPIMIEFHHDEAADSNVTIEAQHGLSEER